MNAILEKIVDLLSGISGLEAIVLGGSQARAHKIATLTSTLACIITKKQLIGPKWRNKPRN